jgi:glycolate oxidase FAD binding subunit
VDLIHPHGKRDLAESLRAASEAGTRVQIVGGRQHIDKGEPVEVDTELWTTLLDDRVAYDPAEMLCVVEAGMRIRDLTSLLAEGGQEWPVDAPDDATVGGVIATGGPTPRQLRVGTMRDTVVEMEVVTGDGRLVRSGARTVKNVTGYDVHRLLTGSLGTLGVIVQVALKVRPLPKASRTLVTRDGGVELGRRVLEAVPLPAAVLAEPERVVVRLEGWPEAIDEQTDAVREVSAVDEIAGAFPEPLFPEARIVAEAAVPPSRLGSLLEAGSAYRAMIGVGFAWVPCDDEGELLRLRDRAAKLGGIAPVIRGAGGLGATTIPAGDVQRRVKAALDPAGILAPGRMLGAARDDEAET